MGPQQTDPGAEDPSMGDPPLTEILAHVSFKSHDGVLEQPRAGDEKHETHVIVATSPSTKSEPAARSEAPEGALFTAPQKRTSLVRFNSAGGQTAADEEGTSQGGASRIDDALQEAHAAFWRWGRGLGFTDAAIQDWLDLADHPKACIALVHAGGVIQAALALVTFVWASPAIVYRHVLAYLVAALYFANSAGVWRFGPHFFARQGKPLPPLTGVTVITLILLGFLSFGSNSVPFGSEFVYLVVMSLYLFVMTVGGLFIAPADQKLVKHMTLTGMLWVGLVRSARTVDAASDVGFAINLVVKSTDACSVDPASCGELRALSGVATFLAATDLLLTMVMNFLGKDFQERKDLKSRRALLSMHAASACCEVGMLTVHALVSFSKDPSTAALAETTNMRLYIAYSALTTVIGLVGNFVGARRLVKLAYIVASSVPAQIKAAVAAASHSRASLVIEDGARASALSNGSIRCLVEAVRQTQAGNGSNSGTAKESMRSTQSRASSGNVLGGRRDPFCCTIPHQVPRVIFDQRQSDAPLYLEEDVSDNASPVLFTTVVITDAEGDAT